MKQLLVAGEAFRCVIFACVGSIPLAFGMTEGDSVRVQGDGSVLDSPVGVEQWLLHGIGNRRDDGRRVMGR